MLILLKNYIKNLKSPLLILAIVLLFCNSIGANSLELNKIKEEAQKEFIESNYTKANTLFGLICIHYDATFSDKKYAIKMRSLLNEKYLVNIDSAIILYSEYLNTYCLTSREKNVTEEKLFFLNNLGSSKKQYGKYQKIVFTNTSDAKRALELDQFNKKYPNFIKRKESLKQCAIAGLNSEMYVLSFNAYDNIKKEYPPLSPTEEIQYSLCKRMVIRYRIVQLVYLIWVITLLILIKEITNIFKKRNFKINYFKILIFIWLPILTLICLTYFLLISNGDHNPFRLSDIILMSVVFTLSIFLNSHIALNKYKNSYKILVSIFTTLMIIGTAYFSTYNRPDRILVMDDLYDQIGDLIIKDTNGGKRENTQD